MADKQTTSRSRRSLARVLFGFLGSMNLAITLLVAVAITSVIGTVLQQNDSYNSYIIKFGPFWFEVFKTLRLYDLYHAVWFLLILAFLVVSTCICVYRNTPRMLRDARRWRVNVAEKSLGAFKLKQRWICKQERDRAAANAEDFLGAHGYPSRRREHEHHTVIAAKRGGAHRIGYLFTHVAIIVIGVGALVDGNIPLMIGEKLGRVVVETRDVPISKLRPESFLAADNTSFRGNISIPEGEAANFIFLRVRDGFLVQRLPFTVEVEDFRIEHYDNGQPKSFESDLVIRDDDLDTPLRRTIAVNHPLSYKGVTIYQSSFDDGGSQLQGRAYSLLRAGAGPVAFAGKVGGDISMETAIGPLTVEFTDFRLFNIHNFSGEADQQDFKNIGPSFKYKLRRPDGRAHEYHNYMQPLEIEGRWFILTGARSSPAEDFSYLHIPVGPDKTVDRFIKLLTLARDDDKLRQTAERIAALALSVKKTVDAATGREIAAKTIELARLFTTGGLRAVERLVIDTFEEDRREQGLRAYTNILRIVMLALYEQVLQSEGIDVDKGLSDEQDWFFQDALTTISNLPDYGAAVYLQLDGFKHIQATGLEMTRSPGKYVVFLGSGLLMIGVFVLFYLHQRRLWVYIKDTAEGTEILFAGSDNRNSLDFAKEFGKLRTDLQTKLSR